MPGGLGQTPRHEFFADGAAFPRFRALRVISDREDQPAELRMVGADPPFPVVSAALVFASRGRPRRARAGVPSVVFAFDTADGLRAALVDGVRAVR